MSRFAIACDVSMKSTLVTESLENLLLEREE